MVVTTDAASTSFVPAEPGVPPDRALSVDAVGTFVKKTGEASMPLPLPGVLTTTAQGLELLRQQEALKTRKAMLIPHAPRFAVTHLPCHLHSPSLQCTAISNCSDYRETVGSRREGRLRRLSQRGQYGMSIDLRQDGVRPAKGIWYKRACHDVCANGAVRHGQNVPMHGKNSLIRPARTKAHAGISSA